MLKTLRISFSLKNTYRVNSILYAIKQIPLLKKIIPDAVYQLRGFKIAANVLSVIWEIISTFAGKLLYFFIMLALPIGLYSFPKEMESGLFLHLMVLLTIIGAFANSFMFNPTKDKYYAMILLGMDAKQYTVVNYFYALLKHIAGFALCGFSFGMTNGLKAWQCLLIPFFAAGTKLAASAYSLVLYDKKNKVRNENKLGVAGWLFVALMLAAAYGLPVTEIILPEMLSVIIMCAAILLGTISVKKILSFGSYRAMYKILLNNVVGAQMDKQAQIRIQREQSHKSISSDSGISSGRKGFEYLNELFIKRHRKILWNAAEKISIVVIVLVAGAIVLFRFEPDMKDKLNRALMDSLPYFVFVMYLVNRGTGFTRACFINCDHSLLTYSFYKKPKFILKLFQIRLREIIKVNLLPAAAIGAGLAALLYASGGTGNPVNYVVLFVSTVAMSVFFSVHYLMLYYLLQPYNAGTEMKSGAYRIIVSATYIVCYLMINFKVPTLVFGIMTIAFCVLYCIVASILVYRLAPKTFRIRA